MRRVSVVAVLLFPLASVWAQSNGASAEKKEGCYELRLHVKECWQNHWENVFEFNTEKKQLNPHDLNGDWVGDVDSFGAFASNARERLELSISIPSDVSKILLGKVSVLLRRSTFENSYNERDSGWSKPELYTHSWDDVLLVPGEYGTFFVHLGNDSLIFRKLKTGELIAVMQTWNPETHLHVPTSYAVLTRVAADPKDHLAPCRLDLKKFSLPDSAKAQKALSKI